MKYNKWLIYLMIGAGIVVLILLLFIYVFNVYFISYSGDKGIVESKARQIFFWKDFPMTIMPYGVSVYENDNSFFPNYSLYRTYADTLPWILLTSQSQDNAVIAVGDHRAYFLPDEFNDVITSENLDINSEEKALQIADVYVNSSCVYGIGKLLHNVSDIPGLSQDDLLNLYNNTREYNDNAIYEERRMQRERMESAIAPPVVSLEGDGYVVDFYSWKELMGVLEKWKVKVGKNGAITVINEKKIDSQIGNNFGLG